MNGERMVSYELNPTITAGAYSAGDVVGGLLQFPILGREAFGFVRGVSITDDDNEKAACKLHLFGSAPTVFADNAAFAPTINDLRNRIAVVTISASDYTTINNNAQAIVSTNTSLDFAVSAGTVIYGYLVCDATPTYTATTDLYIRLIAYLF